MKYSLRSLFVVVTLICVALGGRIEYLRRWATFHEREANQIAGEIELDQNLPSNKLGLFLDPDDPFPPKFRGETVIVEDSPGVTFTARVDERFRRYDHHRKLAAEYRAAAYRPWTNIREPELSQ